MHRLLLEGLARHVADFCVWSHPVGGLFLWLRFPDDVDQTKLAHLAEERGLKYIAGRRFHADRDRLFSEMNDGML